MFSSALGVYVVFVVGPMICLPHTAYGGSPLPCTIVGCAFLPFRRSSSSTSGVVSSPALLNHYCMLFLPSSVPRNLALSSDLTVMFPIRTLINTVFVHPFVFFPIVTLFSPSISVVPNTVCILLFHGSLFRVKSTSLNLSTPKCSCRFWNIIVEDHLSGTVIISSSQPVTSSRGTPSNSSSW